MSNKAYSFLVAAALQEELNEFYMLKKQFKKKKEVEDDAYEISFTYQSRTFNILTYTPNVMGMPYNAAALMNIINLHNPQYTLYIGTCAGLIDKNREIGDVLIPARVFSYESGKYEDGKFQPDHVSYETGRRLRKQAEITSSNGKHRVFKVFTDENFYSGAAVINDKSKRNKITKNVARKVTGLDMEAYSIACINSIVHANKELIVIKGISDFAIDKASNEISGGKKLAMKNSAKFALELILHLQENFISIEKNDETNLPSQTSDHSVEHVNKRKHEDISQTKVSTPPFGNTISIRGSNGLYVSSEDGSKAMECNRDNPGPWECFHVVDAYDGKFALQNNGKFVSSENGISPITCNRRTIGTWEKFDWIIDEKGNVGFKGSNLCFVSSQDGKEPMTCRNSIMKSWETFQVNILPGQTQQNIKREKRLLQSNNLSLRDFQVYQLKRFENNQEIGESGRGKLEIKNGVLNITRFNNDGRLLMKIINYNIDGTDEPFISKNLTSGSIRTLNVQLTAKAVNGSHKLFIICKYADKDKWIHQAFLEITIDNTKWKKFDRIIRLPNDLDFVIDIVDRDVENNDSSLIIKDFAIEENIN